MVADCGRGKTFIKETFEDILLEALRNEKDNAAHAETATTASEGKIKETAQAKPETEIEAAIFTRDLSRS